MWRDADVDERKVLRQNRLKEDVYSCYMDEIRNRPIVAILMEEAQEATEEKSVAC